MSQKLSRSRWVKVKSLTELMTNVVTRTVDCVLCERENCIAIVTGPPKVTILVSREVPMPCVPVTPCAGGENYPAVISDADIAEGGIYRLVLTEPKNKNKP